MRPRGLITFLALVCIILAGWHYYLWMRLVRDMALPDPWRDVATIAIAALGALILFALLARRALPHAIVLPLTWVVFTWMGTAFLLFALLIAADLAGVLLALLPGASPIDPRWLGSSIIVAATALALVALARARPASIRVKHVDVPLGKLSAGAHGYRIAQISDLHIGPTVGQQFVEHVVARVNALQSEMIVITGDLVDGSIEKLGALAAPLANLRARDGVYFITGNHEYYSGQVDGWLDWLEARGIRVLRNERIPIGGAEGFDLAGVHDWAGSRQGNGHGTNLERALAGRDEARALVLLAHQPRLIHLAERLGVDLQISGHTHGGQLFPFNLIVKLFQPHIAGLYSHGRARLYVNRGTGHWGPPMRLWEHSEITAIRLQVIAG